MEHPHQGAEVRRLSSTLLSVSWSLPLLLLDENTPCACLLILDAKQPGRFHICVKNSSYVSLSILIFQRLICGLNG